jgi:glycosyltransferase involved in cell wall biosynthesis
MLTAIATPNLTDGDGVGNDVLGMARALRAAGRRVELFAESARVAEDVRPLAELPRAVGRGDVLIYHHSIKCEAGVRAVEELPGRAVVKYHNITPPRFFAGVNPDAVEGAEVGLRQAARLARSNAAIWVDSAFNGRELAAVVPGREFEELPPFHQVNRFSAAAPDAHAVAGLDGWGTTVLCVGRVAPNKNLVLAADAFAEYRRRFDPTARLVVAGEHIFRPYSEAVESRVKGHGLERHVIVTGRVTVPQLKALYLTADALLVTSDHEGFCVPLVEAMSLGVPVVAVPHTAIPDTAGAAARYALATPEALAEALHEVIADGESRERHLLAGRERYEDRFTSAAIGRRFFELLDAVS